ncbi:MAG: hypothetical protein CME65_10270 [Halobacteriovoraceae bacterium]|nr:hypothetical protein [Halobacteriovoraceae bacterium]|tara:strand:- start:10622 stop:12517 length:1896 start_codon:yes stop_codon:yes gene_type:complete
MKYFLLLVLALTTACSFKGSKEKTDSASTQALKPSDLKKMDSDGDLISDFDEKQKGLDPFVANLPKLRVNFLQDYSIKVDFENETQFSMDTKVARDNPDFKYRVGNLFVKENSYDNAAKLGRFSGVSWGEVKQQDFSWVKYPDIDKDFYYNKAREYRYWSKSKVRESSITLENTLRLMESPLFESIEQVELNFYYYSYSKESYTLLHTEKLERVFQSGTREDFQIIINNPPKELIEDTYFRHGEFIISEVKDFYIPSLKSKYSDLLASVRSKSIPVYKTTPFKNDLSYVAINPKGEKFISILSKLFSDKFEVQGDKLVQVEQFSDNLSDFTYLHEVSKEDKLGKWFVMTNKIKNHYLKHNFTNKDAITLSYLTGSELSKRTQEKIYSFSKDVKSEDAGKLYGLGNITRNSQIDLSIYLNQLEGIQLDVEHGQFHYRPPNCRNCTGTNWSVSAQFQVNRFSGFKNQWFVRDLEEAKKSFEILINNKALPLEELIAQNHATLELKGDESFSYLHITIKNVDELDVIESGKENVAFIKVKPLSVGHAGVGVQINSMGGHNIDKVYHAGLVSLQEAARRKVPLAITSWKFDDWKVNVPWGVPDSRTGYKPTKGSKKKYWTGTVVDIISTITNNYN